VLTQITGSESQVLEERRKSSEIALVSVTQMTVDIARAHGRNINSNNSGALSPYCIYMFRAALEYLEGHPYADLDAWIGDCEAVRVTQELFQRRWGRSARANNGLVM
jgi:hypothetical protein